MDDILGWLENTTHEPNGFGRGLADWIDDFAVWMFGNDLVDMDGDGDRDMTDAGLAMEAVANQALQDMNNPGGVVTFAGHVMDAVAFGYYGTYFRHVGGVIDQIQGD